MHELSIASSILDIALRKTPRNCALRCVSVRAGAMRQINPQAMQWAWQAATANTDAAGSKLELEILPWTLRCQGCAREFDSDDPLAPCPHCGCCQSIPGGGDELLLLSLEVDPKEVNYESRAG
jgi:hydrogenase nickel incorporation protein HypA/HybF